MIKPKVLVVGNGGREQAFVNALSGRADVHQVTADVVEYVKANSIQLVVIGPEQPLVDGLADELAGLCTVIGPSAAAAALEGSKAFMKDVVSAAGVPTAAYAEFDALAPAQAYLDKVGAPIVLKTDGLAAGKGVAVCATLDEAQTGLAEYFAGKFGSAGQRVIIEECMIGPEVSVFYLVKNGRVRLLGSAQDHKRLLDGDEGPNTGGMGTFAPSPLFTAELAQLVERDFILPTLDEMERRGCPFDGFLFAGLMLTPEGPKLLEYNVRMGDPETQSLLPLLKNNLFDVLTSGSEVELTDQHAVTVVIAAPGYPFDPQKGGVVCTEEQLTSVSESIPGTVVTVAGAQLVDGNWIATGGRVLGITAVADSFSAARSRAYQAVQAIGWADGQYRSDIGASSR